MSKSIKEEVLRVLGKYQDQIITITDKNIFDNYISSCVRTGAIAIDTETNNSLDPITCKIMGLCLYAPGLKAAYIPVNHRNPVNKVRFANQLTEKDIKEGLQKVLEEKVKVIMHNGKFDYEVLKCTCDICIVPDWDTMVAAKLLNENEGAGLKHQYVSKIDKTQEDYSIEKLFKNVQYADVEPEIFALYSAQDAFMTYKLYEYQIPMMESEKRIYELFRKIEMPLVPIVAEMELCGAVADVEYCRKLRDKYDAKLEGIDKELNSELDKIKDLIEDWKKSPLGLEKEILFPDENKIKSMTDKELRKKFPLFDPVSGQRYKYGKSYAALLSDPIKLSSSKQLGILLYKVLGARIVNRRKPNSTGKYEIEEIRDLESGAVGAYEHDPVMNYMEPEELQKSRSLKSICALLMERRQVDKLISTYLKPIPALANHWKDGKVRYHLNPVGAHTGRFTSGGSWNFYEDEEKVEISGMNAQNLPSENHEVRLIFRAEPGRVFVGGDISQQEPKITAHISQDEDMLQVFEEGKDIYASIAQSIFHNKYEDNLEFSDPEKTKTNPEGKARRKVGKVIILATMYGMGKNSVARKLEIAPEAAESMLDAFYSQYKGVKEAIDFSVEHCKKYGFVEDIMGRKRRLPNIQLPQYQTEFITEPTKENLTSEYLLKNYLEEKGTLSNKELEELRKQYKEQNIRIICNDDLIKKAERQSFNARIQGSAATLTKMIMVMVDRDPVIKKLGGRMVFQIHDELILDCPIENAEEVKVRLKTIMENSSAAVGVVLPMKCDMTIETRWGEGAMTTELRDTYNKLAEKSENALDELCEEFSNFPKESIGKIISSDDEILEFEW